MRTLFWTRLIILLAACNLPVHAAQLATVRGTCVDAVTGQPVACTVTIIDSTGKRLVEHESFKQGFRCAGHFAKQLAPGRTQVLVTRGFETELIYHDLELREGDETNLTFRLARRVDMRARRWYSGDSHAHMLHGERTLPVDFDFVALSARAEDLQYLSLAQAWPLEQPTPERLGAELGARSRPECVLTWNLEAPKNYYKGDAGRCLGHCWTLGMRGRSATGSDVIQELLNASAWDYESQKPSYANFESHRLIHAQGGAVFYTHPARWWMGSWGGQGGYPKVEQMRVSNMAVELPLDTVLGPTYDGIDVLTTSGEREANAKAFGIWAMLLNHGYRLAATASSDSCFDRPGGAVPGSARTYTCLEHGFSLAKATRATATGHTVATTGPLLIPILDGKPPGSRFRPGGKEHVLDIEAWAAGFSRDGLKLVEVLRNGQSWKRYLLPDQPKAFKTKVIFRETENAWYCVRVSGAEAGQVAISSAFYFASRALKSPPPAIAKVYARIIDAESHQPLAGNLVEITMEGATPNAVKTRRFNSGSIRLSIPATARLRAEVPGYRPLMLSPIFDFPALIENVTTLSDVDLCKWENYERTRDMLQNIDLVFPMQRER